MCPESNRTDDLELTVQTARELLASLDGGGMAVKQQTLHRFSTVDPHALAAFLLPFLADSDPIIQVSTAIFFIQLRLPDATLRVVPFLHHPDAMVRWHTAGMLEEGNEDAVEQLSQVVLHDPDPDVRFTAVTTLGRMGDSRALPALAHSHVHDRGEDYEERSVSRAAAEAIALIQHRSGSP